MGSKEKKNSPVKEDSNSDEDVESVESFSSTSSVTKKRRKTNKTGFPTPKKQKKMDDYLTKKSSKSNPVASAASKRSAALKAKNYSEVESDTDSLLETAVITPAPAPTPEKKLKPTSVQKNVISAERL